MRAIRSALISRRRARDASARPAADQGGALFGGTVPPISAVMRALPAACGLVVVLAHVVLVQAALADTPPKLPPHHAKAGPQAIGTFEDWTAATNKEAGQTVCYAFTRAHTSVPVLPGRGDVVLTVTERPGGRDAVAISEGFAFAANATAKLAIDDVGFELYTAQRSAFARDGHAAVAAMQHGRQAVAHAPGPKAADITDTFSLKGFAQAYAAIVKHCPAGKGSG